MRTKIYGFFLNPSPGNSSNSGRDMEEIAANEWMRLAHLLLEKGPLDALTCKSLLSIVYEVFLEWGFHSILCGLLVSPARIDQKLASAWRSETPPSPNLILHSLYNSICQLLFKQCLSVFARSSNGAVFRRNKIWMCRDSWMIANILFPSLIPASTFRMPCFHISTGCTVNRYTFAAYLEILFMKKTNKGTGRYKTLNLVELRLWSWNTKC